MSTRPNALLAGGVRTLRVLQVVHNDVGALAGELDRGGDTQCA
jgi:hypothetical protein